MWNCCIPDKFKNVNLIFPTQQADVSKIIDAARKDLNVKKVFIFGSSVTWACNPWSDIDVFFVLDTKQDMPVCGCENPVDKWCNFDVDDNLLQEILNTGVVVYDRDTDKHGV